MSSATIKIKNDHYRMQVKSGSGNSLIADEPVEVGGKNLGFSPDELLCAALGACTSATLRMYADRKKWPLEQVEVLVSFERQNLFSETNIQRRIIFTGDLSNEQKEKLKEIADKCPLHKTLSNPIQIETFL